VERHSAKGNSKVRPNVSLLRWMGRPSQAHAGVTDPAGPITPRGETYRRQAEGSSRLQKPNKRGLSGKT